MHTSFTAVLQRVQLEFPREQELRSAQDKICVVNRKPDVQKETES